MSVGAGGCVRWLEIFFQLFIGIWGNRRYGDARKSASSVVVRDAERIEVVCMAEASRRYFTHIAKIDRRTEKWHERRYGTSCSGRIGLFSPVVEYPLATGG